MVQCLHRGLCMQSWTRHLLVGVAYSPYNHQRLRGNKNRAWCPNIHPTPCHRPLCYNGQNSGMRELRFGRVDLGLNLRPTFLKDHPCGTGKASPTYTDF